jgi:uncharacterized iron-regulated membrane protein
VKLRPVLLTSHLIIGATLAPILVLLGITGAILAVQPELEDASNSLLTHIEPGRTPLTLQDLTARLQPQYPGATLASVMFPGRTDRALQLALHRPDSADVSLVVNPYNGAILGLEDEIWTLRPVHDFHTKLGIASFGSAITGWAAVGLLFLATTGMILWWPGKVFTIVRTGSARRILFHLHSALAAYSWLWLGIFGITGLVLHWQSLAYNLVAEATNAAPLRDPSSLPAASCPADSAVGFDRLLATASAAEPGAQVTWIQGGGQPGAAVRVAFKYPEDRTPAGRTQVYLNPCSGEVLSTVSTRTAPFVYRMVREWNRELHTGDLLGWPTRLLAFFFSLTLPVVAVTGPLLWWSRRKKSVERGNGKYGER